MEEQTRVHQMEVRQRRRWIQPPLPEETPVQTTAQLTELPKPVRGLRALVQPENLGKNLAVVGCLALVVLALSHTGSEEDVSVFSALKSDMTAKWDEDVGKLSFVSDLLPPEIREVWNSTAAVTVMAPVNGQVVHAWSAQEPYLELRSNVSDIRSSGDGEVMSVAHGLAEERIIRIRHYNGTETLYGNLQTTFVEAGSLVQTGEIIGTLLPDKPLAFELRLDGRSIDPLPCMAELSQ